jgi:ribosomal protein S18 acetylase RimI-like enzyme
VYFSASINRQMILPRWWCSVLVAIFGGWHFFSSSIHQVQALVVPKLTTVFSSNSRTTVNQHIRMATTAPTTDHDEKVTIQYRPLQNDDDDDDDDSDDQEIVWKILMNAAHETELEDVKSNPLLQPYAQSFGRQPGDIGVVAIATTRPPTSPENHHLEDATFSENDDVAVGAAWVRLLAGNGFAASVLEDPTPVKNMPELAIACLPEYRGQAIGSNLLRALLRAVKEESNYPGVCLSCREDNRPAMKLYERMGFTVVPESKTTNRTGGTSVTMKHVFVHPHDDDDDDDGKVGT